MVGTSYRRYDRHRLAAWRARGVSTLVTPPTDEPVSVTTFKRHAGITDTALDADLLPLRLRAAREFIENYTGRALWVQTWRDTFDELPYGYAPLLLGKAPLITVAPAPSPIVSITQYSTTDVATVLAASSYRVDTQTEPARLVIDDGLYWNDDPRVYGSLAVEYTVGYGTDEDLIPASLRYAIILLATQWSTYLEAASDVDIKEMPLGLRGMLDPFVVAA